MLAIQHDHPQTLLLCSGFGGIASGLKANGSPLVDAPAMWFQEALNPKPLNRTSGLF